jgi:hypothetical protein
MKRSCALEMVGVEGVQEIVRQTSPLPAAEMK